MEKTIYSWYVEPLDGHTNEVIARRLASSRAVFNNYLFPEMKDNYGLTHSVWLAPDYNFISALYKSQNDLALKFNVFSQRNQEPIRLWILGKKIKKLCR